MHDILCTAARKWSAQEDRSNPDQLEEAGWVQASEALACSTVAVWHEGRKGLAQDSAQAEGAPQVHVTVIHMACKQPEGQGAPQVHVALIHMACKQHSQDSEPAQLLFSLCTPLPGQHKHRCCHSRMLQSALIGWSLHSTRCLGQQWTTASPLPCLPAYDSLG